MTIEFLTEKELAKALRCSVPAVRRWRYDGMPVKRFGRLVRFELPTVLAWFEQRDAQRRAKEEEVAVNA
jgi:excisionase family DNA binding protein